MVIDSNATAWNMADTEVAGEVQPRTRVSALVWSDLLQSMVWSCLQGVGEARWWFQGAEEVVVGWREGLVGVSINENCTMLEVRAARVGVRPFLLALSPTDNQRVVGWGGGGGAW
jgi:hypothetical protein